MTLASAIEWDNLLEVVWVSVLASVAVTLAFSLAILGATRAVDLRRDGHHALATAFVAIMILGLAATAASTVFGIVVMTSK